MRVWFNQQLSPSIARWMRERFPDVEAFAVRDVGLRDGSDIAIFEAAASAVAVVVTKDADFVELSRTRRDAPQVVWLTCGNTSNARLKAIFEAVWQRLRERLEAGERIVQIHDEHALLYVASGSF